MNSGVRKTSGIPAPGTPRGLRRALPSLGSVRVQVYKVEGWVRGARRPLKGRAFHAGAMAFFLLEGERYWHLISSYLALRWVLNLRNVPPPIYHNLQTTHTKIVPKSQTVFNKRKKTHFHMTTSWISAYTLLCTTNLKQEFQNRRVFWKKENEIYSG